MTILVVGGGIGGLSAALALSLEGFEVDLIERDPVWGVYGVGIAQPPNALRALDRLGVARACVDVGHPIVGDRSWLADGCTEVGAMRWLPLVEGLPPGNGITRPKFHSVLKAAARAAGVQLAVGVSVAAFNDTGDRVEVVRSDGRQKTYELVVAADGLYSQTRENVLGPSYKPRPTGQVSWRYVLPRLDGLDEIWEFRGPSGTLGLVPSDEHWMYAYLTEAPAADLVEALDRDGPAAVLREHLAGFGGPIAGLLNQMSDDASVVLRPLEGALVMRPWYQGRIVVIGDAVHGMSPHCDQGAAQAIEDGVVLAEELGRRSPLAAALAAFMDRRFDRAIGIAERSLAIGRWEQDRSLPIDPDRVRAEVLAAAALPL
ncbi:MAG: FAD-dependent monooxygenase [Solirubrobacteraceae bacterium]